MLKPFLFAGLLCIGLSMPHISFAQHHIEGKGQVSVAELELQAQKNRASRQQASTVGDNYDLVYHRLEWTVDPAIRYIRGKVSSYFKPTLNSINFLEFDLSSALTVDSVMYHQNKVNFVHSAGVLRINLPLPLAKGYLDSVTVIYHGVPSSSGNGSFATGLHNGVPILWTLSQPNGAFDWWPCKQSLTDKIDSVDMLIRVPKGYISAGNGLLVSRVDESNTTLCHWKTKYPITSYLLAIAVTNYEEHKHHIVLNQGDTLPIVNYIYPESQDQLEDALKINEMMLLFDSLIGPYPFKNEKYGHAEFGWAGGMEHQTMSFMRNFDYGLMSHELAHQWFGDYITCASWKDIWVNEGFATYFAAVNDEVLRPPSEFLAWKLYTRENIISVPDGSVYCPDTINTSRIFSSRLSYNKAAFMLHMLRWKIGDSSFFAAIRNYVNDSRLAYGYARSADVIKHFETASGKNLNQFFSDWLYGEGFPTYQVDITYTFKKLKVKLNQTTSHSSVAFYAMPVPIRFTAGSLDTTIVFDHTYSGQEFFVDIPFKPILVSFDPEIKLLSGRNSLNWQVLDLDGLRTEQAEWRIWPNPSDGKLFLSGIFIAGNAKIRIVNILGEVVFSQEVQMQDGFNEFSLDIQAINRGIYMLEIESADHLISSKVIKQ